MTASLDSPGVRNTISVDMIRHGVVWLIFASSFVVFIEPAPTDLLFFLSIALFASVGLRYSPALTPLIIGLVLFMVGGVTSLMLVYNEFEAIKYIGVSAYMAASAVFFAGYIADSPEKRIKLISNGWIVGAFVASVLGIIGALNIAGTGELMSLQGRAQGLFKDPNVYSTFVIFPAVLLIQRMILGDTRYRILTVFGLLIMMAGLFLSFSRGAWLNFLLASFIMVVTSFALSQNAAQRARILLLVSIGAIAMIVIVAGLLSIENVRDLFLDRFTLTKDYDSGETGRFANQLVSVPYLITAPFGVGPYNYRNVFYFDPHNVYLNGFASYGWIGGFSYVFLVLSTFAVGFRSMLPPSAIQPYAIAAFCVFFSTAVQGVQIDTDHWRHFYWLLGMVWGLFAVVPQALDTNR